MTVKHSIFFNFSWGTYKTGHNREICFAFSTESQASWNCAVISSLGFLRYGFQSSNPLLAFQDSKPPISNHKKICNHSLNYIIWNYCLDVPMLGDNDIGTWVDSLGRSKIKNICWNLEITNDCGGTKRRWFLQPHLRGPEVFCTKILAYLVPSDFQLRLEIIWYMCTPRFRIQKILSHLRADQWCPALQPLFLPYLLFF